MHLLLRAGESPQIEDANGLTGRGLARRAHGHFGRNLHAICQMIDREGSKLRVRSQSCFNFPGHSCDSIQNGNCTERTAGNSRENRIGSCQAAEHPAARNAVSQNLTARGRQRPHRVGTRVENGRRSDSILENVPPFVLNQQGNSPGSKIFRVRVVPLQADDCDRDFTAEKFAPERSQKERTRPARVEFPLTPARSAVVQSTCSGIPATAQRLRIYEKHIAPSHALMVVSSLAICIDPLKPERTQA